MVSLPETAKIHYLIPCFFTTPLALDIEKFTHEVPFEAEKFMLRGGGGTDLRPPFDWVHEKMSGELPKALLYMTDGFGPAPSSPPNYPVLWVLNDQGVPPCSWGEIVKIED